MPSNPISPAKSIPFYLQCKYFGVLLAGLIPEATNTIKGLQSANDKKQGFRYYVVSNHSIYQLTDFTGSWQRSSATILGAINGSPVFINVGIYKQETSISATVSGTHVNLFFYKKENNLYMYCNQNESAPNQLAISSFYGVKIISNGVAPDSSYTLI